MSGFVRPSGVGPRLEKVAMRPRVRPHGDDAVARAAYLAHCAVLVARSPAGHAFIGEAGIGAPALHPALRGRHFQPQGKRIAQRARQGNGHVGIGLVIVGVAGGIYGQGIVSAAGVVREREIIRVAAVHRQDGIV